MTKRQSTSLRKQLVINKILLSLLLLLGFIVVGVLFKFLLNNNMPKIFIYIISLFLIVHFFRYCYSIWYDYIDTFSMALDNEPIKCEVVDIIGLREREDIDMIKLLGNSLDPDVVMQMIEKHKSNDRVLKAYLLLKSLDDGKLYFSYGSYLLGTNFKYKRLSFDNNSCCIPYTCLKPNKEAFKKGDIVKAYIYLDNNMKVEAESEYDITLQLVSMRYLSLWKTSTIEDLKNATLFNGAIEA